MNTQSFRIIIEISMESSPVKYEVDKDTGLLSVDRFLQVAMHYPCNYGFIPDTLADDGDPLDVLLITPYPVMPGASILARPIGVLNMEDESGKDEKIIMISDKKIDPSSAHINDIEQLNPFLLRKIKHFFERYKDVDANKWVKVGDWGNAESSLTHIEKALKAYKNS